MKTKAKTLRCPTCGTLVLVGSEDFPFCTDRCRRIDLGKWASGAYVISSPVFNEETGDPELLDKLEGLRGRERTSGGAGSSGDEE